MSGLDKVEVEIAVAIGRCDMPVHALLRLGRGARVPLDVGADGAVEVRASGHPVARGRLVRGREDQVAVEIVDIALSPPG
jgi:flagellar motor switch protein FliN/FliY